MAFQKLNWIGLALGVLLVNWPASMVIGQVESEQSRTAEIDDRSKQLAQSLSGVKLVGNFTVHGRDLSDLSPESYYILSAEKQPEGDFWVITTRIKYGRFDLTVPLALEIKFAGDTPVITVDKLTIPGMGTFDARVLIRPDGYAGTWAHDDVGGHLFGTIEKLTDQELQDLQGRARRNRSTDDKNTSETDR